MKRDYDNRDLVAKVRFHDVDGNLIERIYSDCADVNDLLDKLSIRLTDENNFPNVSSEKFEGINGIIDISKPINITVALQ